MRLRHRKWTDEVIKDASSFAYGFEEMKNIPSLKADTLEIGCGLGGFAIEETSLHPDQKYIAVEVNRNAFATACKNILAAEGVKDRILLINCSIDDLIPYLPTGVFSNIYVNHPDPWPKKRQEHRRLTCPPLLKEYYRLLKEGGRLVFRTDNVGLYEASLGYFESVDLFKTETYDPFLSEDYGISATEYEKKFRAEGVDIKAVVAYKE